MKIIFLEKRTKIFLIIFVFFVLMEMPFRIYDYGFKYKYILSRGQTDIPFEEIQVYLFKSGYCVLDKKLIWRYTKKMNAKNGIYQFNSLGLRTNDDSEPNRTKDNNVYRVIVFGGSHPFGIGVRYEETYAYQLEVLFNSGKHEWGKKIEVINAAIPGYSTIQVLNLLKYQMVKYDPDLVIIDAGNNDGITLKPSWPRRDSQIIKNMNPFLCGMLNVLNRSSFFWYYRLFQNKIINLINAKINNDLDKYSTRVSQKENLENLEEIKKIARGNNFKVIFLSQMIMGEGKLQRGTGVIVDPYLDIYFQLKEKRSISEYFIDSIHGSIKGHREIAEIIYSYLKASSWICGELK